MCGKILFNKLCIKSFLLASITHPNNVITAGLALFFHRANNGLFSSTLIFFLVLNKTMETTKGETYTMAIEQAFIMDVCKIYTAFNYN